MRLLAAIRTGLQFSLRKGKELSRLCKGEMDAAEDHRRQAETELNDVIKAAPHSDDAYAARSALAHFYLRVGRFHDAEAQIEAMLAAKPNAADLANVHSLYALLAAHPDMTVHSDRAASVPNQIIEGNLFAPVTVNGSARSYMLDTGLDLSLMSEVEAKRLRLKPKSSTTRLNDISGLAGSALRVVVVNDLTVGAIHLRHVPFLSVADTNGAFVGIPSDQHGILGIQPLVALRRLSFEANGMLTINGKDEPTATTEPLLFVGTSPITQIAYQGRALPVTFDTGATQTTLNPPFAKAFPEVVRSGQSQNHDMNGLSGTAVQRSVSVPRLSLEFGRKVELAPATILLDQTTGASAWAGANLGFDLMQQARPFTVDFSEMKIEFPDRDDWCVCLMGAE
jgi:predicted aspartyl protease